MSFTVWTCPVCKFERIPGVRIVKKSRKYWKIYTCSMCKLQDIEPYTPVKLWNGSYFEDETIFEEGEPHQ